MLRFTPDRDGLGDHPGEFPTVRAQSTVLPKPYAAGNWCSLSRVRDELYFGLCTHRIDEHALALVWNPAHRTLRTLEGLSALYASEKGSVSQGKIHTAFIEHDSKVYWASHFGYYRPDLQGQQPYPGGHLISYDPVTGAFEDLGIAAPGQGIVGLQIDRRTDAFYLSTWPGGDVVRYSLSARTFTVVGSQQTRPKCADPACRRIAIDGQGNLAFCRADGAVVSIGSDGQLQPTSINLVDEVGKAAARHGYRAHHSLERFWKVLSKKDWPARLPKTVAGQIERSQAWPQFPNMWASVLTDPVSGRLVALSGICGMFFELALDSGTARYLGQLCPAEEVGLLPRLIVPDASCWGPGRVIFHLAVALTDAPGGNGFRSRVHLVSLDLDSGGFQDHGRISIEDGRELIYAYTLEPDGLGRLVTVAWVQLTDPDRIREFSGTSPPPIERRTLLAQENPYEMRLITIEPPPL